MDGRTDGWVDGYEYFFSSMSEERHFISFCSWNPQFDVGSETETADFNGSPHAFTLTISRIPYEVPRRQESALLSQFKYQK
jgi:hypothetical protein